MSTSWSHSDPQTLFYHSRQLKKMSRVVLAAQGPLLGRWVEKRGGGRRRKRAAAAAAGAGARGTASKKIIKNRGKSLETSFGPENPREAPGSPE